MNIIDIKSYFPKDSGKRKEFLHVFLMQCYFTFFQAIPIMALLGTFAGIAVSFQAKMGLALLGGHENLGKILVVVLFREMAPLIGSIVIITRSVTAVASELATMKVNSEIESLDYMGININQYLLGPRILAGTFSILAMSICFLIFSIIGSWVGANWSSYYPFGQFLSSVAMSIRPSDFLFFIFKTTLIGTIVFKVACDRGLSLRSASFEVPIVTNRAVVDSLFLAISMQGIISLFFYLIVGVNIF